MNPSNLTETLSVIQAIQLIIAPAVMINACGLLLLGVSNKFSMLINRIRQLNEEKRHFTMDEHSDFSPLELQRVESIGVQLRELLLRGKFLRNSLVAYFSAIGIFVITSVLIGVDYFSVAINLRMSILYVFLSGLILLFAGVIFGTLDIFLAYKIMKYEVDVDY
ncbi:MAG: DUF2721 domain-containing protein [Bacteroidota bacterium]